MPEFCQAVPMPLMWPRAVPVTWDRALYCPLVLDNLGAKIVLLIYVLVKSALFPAPLSSFPFNAQTEPK